MKKFFIAALIVVLVLVAIVFIFGDDTEDTSKDGQTSVTTVAGLRDLYTKIKGDGSDVNTVMIYMIGSDLESQGGYATLDIKEILKADLGENVNVVIETGGAKSWDIKGIDGDTCQRFKIEDDKLVGVKDIGLKNMTKPDTLSDFINWAAKECPANRYHLIFWDHGGGTVAGFGYDENFPDGMMSINDISKALKNTSTKFDMIGFDACLMGTVETAYVLEPYGDYFVASEETEPGNGWYYTNWLTALGKNPSLDTVSMAKIIIDDFVEDGPDASWFSDSILSVVDLREIPNVHKLLQTYMKNNTAYLKNNGFSEIAAARGDTREFGNGEYEQIDIVDYINHIDIDGGKELKNAIVSAVKYHNSNTYDTHGMAMYYPYSSIEYYDGTASIMDQIGYGDESSTYYDEFVNAMACGQSQDYGMGSFLDSILGSSTEQDYNDDYLSSSWYDEDTSQSYSDYYDDAGYDDLSLDDKGDYYALSLSDEEWDSIVDITLQAMFDDGEGYIDLGCDSLFEFDADGDLIVDFDNTWVAIDGETVPFYTLSYEEKDDTRWVSHGYVPAVLNDSTDIRIMIQWDDEHPDGFILGYQVDSDEISPTGKGYIPFKSGDYVQPVCDYYTYEGEFDDTYCFGDPFEISMDSSISYEDIGDGTVEVCFKLTDIYQNDYWTEVVAIS